MAAAAAVAEEEEAEEETMVYSLSPVMVVEDWRGAAAVEAVEAQEEQEEQEAYTLLSQTRVAQGQQQWTILDQ